MIEYRAQTISTGEMDARLEQMLVQARQVLKDAVKDGKDTKGILDEIDRIVRKMDTV